MPALVVTANDADDDGGGYLEYLSSTLRYYFTFTSVETEPNLRPLEVEIGGRRQGVTKKKLGTAAARLKISKIELFSTFISLRNALRLGDAGDEPSSADEKMSLSLQGSEGSSTATVTREILSSSGNSSSSSLRYADAKKLCRAYREQWNILRDKVFRVWSEKPSSLLDFRLES